MDAKVYLQSYGWKEGEALQHGGLKKPILVKHKKDTKGLGHGSNDADMWWEKLFDGQLKSLEVSSGSNGVNFEQNKDNIQSEINKANSPLYRMFVKGVGLSGTVGKTDHTLSEDKVNYKKALIDTEKLVRKTQAGNGKKDKKDKKHKIDKKEKKDKKDKKDKKEKKAKKEKKEQKEKKEKKEKDHKTESNDKKVKKVKPESKKDDKKEKKEKKIKESKSDLKKSSNKDSSEKKSSKKRKLEETSPENRKRSKSS